MTAGRDLRIALAQEVITRNLLIYALLTEHHARMHLALARFGVASIITSALSVALSPLLLPLAALLAVLVVALLVQLRRGDAAIRARHGGATITLPAVRRRIPGSAAVADAVEIRATCERDHAAALTELLDVEAGR